MSRGQPNPRLIRRSVDHKAQEEAMTALIELFRPFFEPHLRREVQKLYAEPVELPAEGVHGLALLSLLVADPVALERTFAQEHLIEPTFDPTAVKAMEKEMRKRLDEPIPLAEDELDKEVTQILTQIVTHWLNYLILGRDDTTNTIIVTDSMLPAKNDHVDAWRQGIEGRFYGITVDEVTKILCQIKKAHVPNGLLPEPALDILRQYHYFVVAASPSH